MCSLKESHNLSAIAWEMFWQRAHKRTQPASVFMQKRSRLCRSLPNSTQRSNNDKPLRAGRTIRSPGTSILIETMLAWTPRLHRNVAQNICPNHHGWCTSYIWSSRCQIQALLWAPHRQYPLLNRIFVMCATTPVTSLQDAGSLQTRTLQI